MSWLTREDLVEECRTSIAGLLRPHPRQSVRAVRQLVRDLVLQSGQDERGEVEGSVVVLAVDAISYDVAETVLACDELVCLTSTFPSTSVVSWLSSLTGAGPLEHGISGPVALRPEVDGVYNVIRAHGATWGDAGSVVVSAARPRRREVATVFDDLDLLGVASTALVGDFLGICESWITSISSGAVRRDPPRLLDDIRRDPRAIAELAVDQVEAALRQRHHRCVWAYVNLDEHIHYAGYDGALRTVLLQLCRAAERWARNGHTVLLHSDHGQVPNVCDEIQLRAFDRLDRPLLCRFPAGGAGRVRWLYPHAAHESFVLAHLEEALGDDAFVCHRDDIGDIGLTTGQLPGVGEVVAIATGKTFPVPDPAYRYEHGSATAEEMLVPLAIWKRR